MLLLYFLSALCSSVTQELLFNNDSTCTITISPPKDIEYIVLMKVVGKINRKDPNDSPTSTPFRTLDFEKNSDHSYTVDLDNIDSVEGENYAFKLSCVSDDIEEGRAEFYSEIFTYHKGKYVLRSSIMQPYYKNVYFLSGVATIIVMLGIYLGIRRISSKNKI